MKLGYFTMPLHPMERDYAATLREDRESILLAETLGYVEAFVGEHVTDACETITSCLIFIASLAAATSRIRLGSATINLPNAHPAAVASQVAIPRDDRRLRDAALCRPRLGRPRPRPPLDGADGDAGDAGGEPGDRRERLMLVAAQEFRIDAVDQRPVAQVKQRRVH
jgi:hypothetical protein